MRIQTQEARNLQHDEAIHAEEMRSSVPRLLHAWWWNTFDSNTPPKSIFQAIGRTRELNYWHDHYDIRSQVSLLHLAAIAGDHDAVDRFIELDQTSRTPNFPPPRRLQFLCIKNKKNSHLTPFYLSTRYGRSDVLPQLLTILQHAVNYGNKGSQPWPDEKKAAALLRADKDGYTPLHWACAAGNQQAVCQILEFLDNLNLKNSPLLMLHDTPLATRLDIAILSGDMDKVDQVLKPPYDCQLHLPDQLTSLHVAASFGSAQAISTVYREINDRNVFYTHAQQADSSDQQCTPLHAAAFSGNPEAFTTILTLLTDQADRLVVNITRKDLTQTRRSLLHCAARSGNPAMVTEVLQCLQNQGQLTKNELQAIYAQEDRQGRNLLHYAAESGNTETAQLIQATLGRVLGYAKTARLAQSQDHAGETPLHHAARHNNSAMVLAMLDPMLQDLSNTQLITAAKNIAASPNKVGRTPLHEAAKFGDATMVTKILAALGDKASEIAAWPDNEGRTPLHYAAEFGDAGMVHKILDALDDQAAEVIALPDARGEMPLYLAIKSQKNEADQAMLRCLNHQDVHVSTLQKMRPLELAARYCTPEAIAQVIAVIGNDFEHQANTLPREFKRKVYDQKDNAIKNILLPQLVEGKKPLTKAQETFCLRHKPVLVSAFLEKHGMDVKKLKNALNYSTVLGKIVNKFRTNPNDAPTNTTRSRRRIAKQLERAETSASLTTHLSTLVNNTTTLNAEERRFCLRHKTELVSLLIKNHGDNHETLRQALNSNTALGAIVVTHRSKLFGWGKTKSTRRIEAALLQHQSNSQQEPSSKTAHLESNTSFSSYNILASTDRPAPSAPPADTVTEETTNFLTSRPNPSNWLTFHGVVGNPENPDVFGVSRDTDPATTPTTP